MFLEKAVVNPSNVGSWIAGGGGTAGWALVAELFSGDHICGETAGPEVGLAVRPEGGEFSGVVVVSYQSLWLLPTMGD